MEEINKKLQTLYEKKYHLETQIRALESELSHKNRFSKQQKIDLFRQLFIGDPNAYAKRWTDKTTQKTHFYPVTQTFKGDDCLPVNNQAIEDHLRGESTLATYPILYGTLAKYLVIELETPELKGVVSYLNQLGLMACYETTSNDKIYVWIFFDDLIEAKAAKDLGVRIVQHLGLKATLFPNQDFSNASNRGSYLELPLQLTHRQVGKTVFVNPMTLEPFPDQWAYLWSLPKNKASLILFLAEYKDYRNPWEENLTPKPLSKPTLSLELSLYDKIHIEHQSLNKMVLDDLKAMATFDNPQVKTLLALRKPLYNIPHTIKSYEEDQTYLKLPRGLLWDLKAYLDKKEIHYSMKDKRVCTTCDTRKVHYGLREEQQEAIDAIKQYESCICVAPPGFGKTLIGASMIEHRGCTTLVIVNKNMLLGQWIERFVDYFEMDKKEVGFLGKGKNNLNGKLDVATMQSLKNQPELIQGYSQVIVDECHHIPAVTFELIVKQFTGKYILGLSATPKRKDGLEPILFYQLGPIAYEFKKKKSITHNYQLIQTEFNSDADNYAAIISDLCTDSKRNALIIDQVIKYLGRKMLILSDRLEHLSELESLLNQKGIDYVCVHGGLNKKLQQENMQLVQDKSLVLATTSFFGEGIDFPHLNTILFATPISYYGRLIQYLGRIGRNGQKCLAIDFYDRYNGMLSSAYKKRKEGYKQMHYQLLRKEL